MTAIDKILEQIETIDVNSINCDESVKLKLILLINAVEALAQENRKLRDEIDYLKTLYKHGSNNKEDENQESGSKPQDNDKKKNPRPPLEPRSSSASTDSTTPQRRTRSQLTITRTEPRLVNRATLPHDAVHKGWRDVTIQELILQPDIIRFRLERFYSPSTGKLYEAELPPGFQGWEYGPVLRSYILDQYFRNRIPEDKQLQNLNGLGFQISAGEISRILTEKHETFHQEKQAILEAGLSSTNYQHCDHTGAWVNGEKQYHTVLCNEYYSFFSTHPSKERLAVIDVLTGNLKLDYIIDSNTIGYLKKTRIPKKYINVLKRHLSSQSFTAEKLETFLDECFRKLPKRYRDVIFEAAAVAFYQSLDPALQIPILISDDAKEFYHLTAMQALCWIHVARHFDKLQPILAVHQNKLDQFYSQLWEFYQKLKQYKSDPVLALKQSLEDEFDCIFAPTTGYDELDKKIALTAANKAKLLLVLEHPEIPLHNNPAELAVRELVIKRKVSIGTRSLKGTRAWETFMTISDTCRKQKISFFHYIKDRLTQAQQLPSLAELIQQTSRLARAPT
jgi:hypothetical protein